MAGLNVAGYTFSGPFLHVNHLLRQSGVYVISALSGALHEVLDIGESHDVHTRVRNHDRANQWSYHAAGRTLHVSVFYCDEPTRTLMERQLRARFNPACGVR